MLSTILSIVGPLILWVIKTFIKNAEHKERLLRSYYQFLAQNDNNQAKKVANYIAAEEDLKRLQQEIRESELEEPDRPSAKTVQPFSYEIPEIVEVDVKMKTHGQYLTDSGEAKGLVVHYTAGRSESVKDAKNTLRHLARRGLGCLVMDRFGTIYRAKTQTLDKVAWHAGKSEWKGKAGVSRYCMGMEICCAGKLENDGRTWYGDGVSKYDRRRIAPTFQNQKRGLYHKFTKEQEDSLLNFILWQLDTNPEFDIDWVVGHDEIAPKRKTDPGGSLSMTMPQFRDKIRELVKKGQ